MKANPRTLRRQLFAAIACCAAFCATASTAHAQDDDEALPDARLSGYEKPVTLGGGVALSYAILAFLGVISVGLTFKNANRSHLD